MKRFETIVYVAAHQFHVLDAAIQWDGSYSNDPWSGGDGLGVADGVVGIQSPRAAGNAPVFVEVLETEPAAAPDRFEKVTEASIDVGSGRLTVVGEENDESAESLVIDLASGIYSLRVLYSDLNSVTYDDDDGAEHYVLQLWPGTQSEAVITRANEVRDEPVRTTKTTVAAAEAALQSDDASACSHAIVELARAGGIDHVARLGHEHPSRAIRVVAVNALRLVNAKDAIEPFTSSDDAILRGIATRALERLA